MSGKQWHVCSDCLKKMQRCKIVTVDQFGDFVYVCRRCFILFRYTEFVPDLTRVDEE